MRYQGLGTEKLQAEIEEKFPGYVCQRMDSDTMTKPGSHERVLDAFRDGQIHILLGTQMIAKGLDFPNVTLVGVVNADVGLHLPDFRSAERTFQLLAQVAGRAGRGDKGGRVLVQTFTPEHPCIALAAKHDFVDVRGPGAGAPQAAPLPAVPAAGAADRAQREGRSRGAVRRHAGRRVRGGDQARRAAEPEVQTRATPPLASPIRLLGPAECPVFRLNNFYRFHFQVQSADSGVLHDVLRDVLAVAKPPRGVEFQVDVDPFNML